MKQFLNLENLIYIGIIILPTYLVKIRFFGFATNILEMFILLVLILWILEKKYEKILLKDYKKFIFPLFFMFFGLLISAVFNNNFISEAGIIKGWFFLPIVFVFLAIQVIKKENVVNVYKALYLSSFLVSAAAIIFLFLNKITYDGRLEAFFNSPNYLAMYIAPALIILAQYRKPKIENKENNIKFNIMIMFSGAIMLIALYFTYSYASWIAIAVSLLIVEIITKRRVRFNRKIWATGLILLFFMLQLKETKFKDLAGFEQRSSLASRIMIWRTAGNILEKNLILGIGPGNFQEKYLEYQKYYPPYLEWAVPHPHNLYMSFWLSGGVLGLIGFIWIVIIWFKKIIKKDESLVRSFALGIMFYILIHGIFDTTYFKNDLAVIFWLNFLALKL